jgi:hypothetical protein
MFHRPETWFAFLVVPLYFWLCVGLGRAPALKDKRWAMLFPVNWAMGAVVFGLFALFSGLGGGDWIGVSIFSGALGALIGTALALRVRRP